MCCEIVSSIKRKMYIGVGRRVYPGGFGEKSGGMNRIKYVV